MHSATATAIDPYAATDVSDRPPEKVSVRHVRLCLPRQCSSARVGTFFAADKVLLSWALGSREPLECEFEIVYDDGYTLAGQYRFQHKAASRPALMAFVRKTVNALCEGALAGTAGAPSLVRGLGDCPGSFLARYETDDFTSD